MIPSLAGTLTQKKIRTVGSGSWVLPLPKEYGEEIFKEYNSLVELYFLNGWMIVSPVQKEGDALIGKAKIETECFEEVESKITSSYLCAYDKLTLHKLDLSEPKNRARFQKLILRLNVYPKDLGNGTYELTFPLIAEDPRKEVQRAFAITRDLSHSNLEDLKAYPDCPTLKVSSPYNYKEEELDKIAYAAKRRIATIISRPGKYKGYGLGDLRAILDYYLLTLNLERLADLELDVSRHIRKLYESGVPDNIFRDGEYSLIQYYDEAMQFTKEAWNSRANPSQAYKIMATMQNYTKNHMRYIDYNGLIPKKEREELITRINSIDGLEPFAKWRLNLLERTIWKITSTAINIAQIGQNFVWCDTK